MDAYRIGSSGWIKRKRKIAELDERESERVVSGQVFLSFYYPRLRNE